ncbi:MAG: metal-dependent hydrolase [Myxococcota bacterium]
MNPVSHGLVGWLTAEVTPLPRRDRGWILLAGLLPDLDGAGILVDFATGTHPSAGLYAAYHHVVAHNLFFGVALSLAVACVAERRAVTAALAFVSFHLHLLGDLVGSAGPGRSLWTLSYLFPFSDRPFVWQGQWELNAWPNLLITALLLVAVGFIAVRRGRTPLEWVSQRADAALVAALRRRFGA